MVVTTVKRWAMKPARLSAASQMPSTGMSAMARAASSPVSSKQAMIAASAPSLSPRAISSNSPGTASASS